MVFGYARVSTTQQDEALQHDTISTRSARSRLRPRRLGEV